MSQADIFSAGAQRLQMTDSIDLTIQSLLAYGATHEHWGIAWSGGKDSSATLTLITYLLDTGKIARPKSLTVFYADTRQELPPLAIAARQIMDELEERGIRVEVVTAPMDKRFMVYILGRGVPPPNNNTLRWCTRQIKIDPMEQALRDRLDQLDGQILMITGVRQGESAIRDRRIEMSCSKDGAECGQGLLIPNVAMGLSAAAGEKRDSMAARVAKVAEIMAADPDDHFLIWHDLEDERHAIQAAVPGVVSVWGTQDLDQREQRIADFSDGKIKDLSTKPIIAGSGCNFQVHCHREIFAGIGFKFNDFIQAVHRVQRFQQQHAVRIDIIHTEVERKVLADLMEKWRRHDEMQETMSQIIRNYGLDQLSMQDSLARTIGVERAVVAGDRFSVANNDCVLEAMQQPDNSVGMIITSVPFANHYEYTPSYNDFGHTQDNDHFWAQMDFLTPELLRILQPGRIYACHVKDRINFGNVTGAGVPTVSPFHAEALFHGIKHGFDYMGMITVVTDVVRENNQTYRLGYSEVCKDGTKMGVGSPEYILLFHKPQTDRSRGYADVPVTKAKPMCLDDAGDRIPFDRKAAPIPGTGYSVARWQVDAHAFWRSSGDRLLGAAELASFGPGKLAKLFTSMSLDNVYNYEYHVEVGEALLAGKALPADYLSLAPGSADPAVWHDIVRMRTLNGEQSARAVEKHVCPFQIDIVDRLIGRYSNPGEVVYDPFCGLGTVPVRAMKLGRRGAGSELNPAYFADQVHYCQAMEREVSMPTLFDMELMDEENAK